MRAILILLFSTSQLFAFEIGDVVYLKSGSRPMTVIDGSKSGDVTLQWDNGQSLAGGSLPEAALTLKDPIAAINAKRAVDAVLDAAEVKP